MIALLTKQCEVSFARFDILNLICWSFLHTHVLKVISVYYVLIRKVSPQNKMEEKGGMGMGGGTH